MDDDRPHTLTTASRQAMWAADNAGVSIRCLRDVDELTGVVALFDEVWLSSGASPLGVEHLRALAHAGNYVSGAFDAGTLLGASVGFFGTPLAMSMHSDVTAVTRGARGRNVGFALKLHQRAWALELGLQQITWTFDPLVARNAHFNLTKLGARVRHYLDDFYGDMADAVNAGQGSDRLLAAWSLADPSVALAIAGASGPRVETVVAAAAPPVAATPALLDDHEGEPAVSAVPSGTATVRVAVPHDIESVRRTNPHTARAWRAAVRATLGAELHGGGEVVSFDEGHYLVRRAQR